LKINIPKSIVSDIIVTGKIYPSALPAVLDAI